MNMGRIKGWRKTIDRIDRIVYVKINSPLRLTISKVRHKYWNINLYEKEINGFRFVKNLQRGIDTKKEAKAWAVNYMR